LDKVSAGQRRLEFESMPEQKCPSIASQQLISVEGIERRIFLIRGHRIILDNDLAALYGVSTRRLNEQVRRNSSRFPDDFMFQLTIKEAEVLRSQNATSKTGRGGRRYLPLVFTEQGVAMLSSVLNSDRAILVNIVIMRTFVRLRDIQAAYRDFARRLERLQRKYSAHDVQIQQIFACIKKLMAPPLSGPRQIGFVSPKKGFCRVGDGVAPR